MLERLCSELDRHLGDDPRGGSVARWLENYAGVADDWRKFALFGADYYSRNLVYRSELYELIVLCWGPGQRSPIHDHSGQRCWMAVLDGQVRESLFQLASDESHVVPGAVKHFERGSVAYIVDEVAWHRIEPAGDSSAVTLHLYSRPIGACRIFDEAEGRVRQRTMSYHSVAGLLTPMRS